MNPTHTAYGIWSGGRYMHFGEAIAEERFLASIHHAHEKGIHTFMTADAYGAGDADTMLGRGLEGIDRDSYCLVGAVGHDFYKGERAGSKGYPRFTNPDLRGPGDYAEYLKTATEKSLERIGQDRFDLLLLHNPDATGYRDDSVWDGMQQLKEAGLANLIGVAPGPANGFTLDLIGCFEKFGNLIDWAMIILNPVEPWPGSLVLPAADKFGVKLITRVVDHGGIFHDDVKAGHIFGEKDHRTFRPQGWVQAGNEKLEAMRPFAEAHGLSMLQLACQWNLAHPAIASVAPTLIQESAENPGAKSIEEKIQDLAAVPEKILLSDDEVARIAEIGDNKGCMALKGGTPVFEGDGYVPDAWPLTPDLEEIGQRWGIAPAQDLVLTH